MTVLQRLQADQMQLLKVRKKDQGMSVAVDIEMRMTKEMVE
jgi:hypothetical protein